MTDDRNQSNLPVQQTVDALETLIAHLSITVRYRTYMTNIIFPLGPPLKSNHGLGKNHQSFLLEMASYHALLIIWKESSFVTPADLKVLGASKAFISTPLNCNSLAMHIADGKAELDRARQHVQKLVRIAVQYGLVGRTVLDSYNGLNGTQHLHDMFVAIGAWSGVLTSPLRSTVISAQA